MSVKSLINSSIKSFDKILKHVLNVKQYIYILSIFVENLLH